jgi:small membrane protein
MIFQVLAGLTLAGAMLWFLVVVRSRTLVRLFIAALFLAGLVLLLVPELTTTLARRVGIGRGADLITYVSLIFFFVTGVAFYLRFKRIEVQLTEIVRGLALLAPVQRPEAARDERARLSSGGAGSP